MTKTTNFWMVLLGFVILSASIFAAGAQKQQQSGKIQLPDYLKIKSPLVFNLPNGDIKTTIIPEGTHLLYNKSWLNNTQKDRGIQVPKRNNTPEYNDTRPRGLGVELVVDVYEQKNNLKVVTTDIERLAGPKGAHGCLISLGNESYRCRVEKVTTEYGGFLKDGTPTFAVMNLTLSRFARVKR